MSDALNVNIVNQDRRHVLDILLKEIDSRINHSSYYFQSNSSLKVLNPKKFPVRVQKALEKLQELDEQARQIDVKVRAAQHKLEGFLLGAATIDHQQVRSTGWKRFCLRETEAQYRDRIEGTKEARAKRKALLLDLKDRLLIAAAGDGSVEPFIHELRQITGGPTAE